MAEKAVNRGDSVSAVCTVVNGDSPLEIGWALNDTPIDQTHRISVTTTKRNSLLSIESASPSNAGTYTCVASNAAGATSYSTELTVNGTYVYHTETSERRYPSSVPPFPPFIRVLLGR
ncbi:cell adhesion molecule Dscam1-like [Ptiloglossa arizonensis]|uniref:cell adhesion molecule Dscam1-like n=1 Tax=Ptiloglossa arizonensis TaxID=3350558 RepID=UPI003FA0DBD1